MEIAGGNSLRLFTIQKNTAICRPGLQRPGIFTERTDYQMKELKLQKRPEYRLLKQSDAVTFFHMQMPRWLFSDPKYTPLSLESKVAYTFLLNRFQLSKMNGWINSDGEVFIIFPREKLAEEMGISYRKAIDCFKFWRAASWMFCRRTRLGYSETLSSGFSILIASGWETPSCPAR